MAEANYSVATDVVLDKAALLRAVNWVCNQGKPPEEVTLTYDDLMVVGQDEEDKDVIRLTYVLTYHPHGHKVVVMLAYSRDFLRELEEIGQAVPGGGSA